MFGKKKKPEDVDVSTIETNTVDEEKVKVNEPKEKVTEDIDGKKVKEKVELTPEQQEIYAIIQEFKEKYSQIFTHEDFALIRLEPTVCSLLMAVYAEIKGLREDITKME